jgi:hypothetical protein
VVKPRWGNFSRAAPENDRLKKIEKVLDLRITLSYITHVSMNDHKEDTTMTVEKAIDLLQLTETQVPRNEDEQELLVRMVQKWIDQHGQEWVRNNFLLGLEWSRHRRTHVN